MPRLQGQGRQGRQGGQDLEAEVSRDSRNTWNSWAASPGTSGVSRRPGVIWVIRVEGLPEETPELERKTSATEGPTTGWASGKTESCLGWVQRCLYHREFI